MKVYRFIALSVCILYSVLCTPLYALSTEQEQQFTYYFYAAKQAAEQEKYPEALALFEFCHAINPNDGQTMTFLGVLYDAIGKKEEGLAMLKQAFEADPRDQWYKYSYALLEQRTPEGVQEAIHVLEKAQTITPDDEDLLDQLLRLYGSTEQWAKAIKTLDQLDKVRGFDGMSALSRYRIFRMWGKPKKAIEAVDKYLEQDPTNLQFLLFRLETMERTKTKMSVLYAMYEKILKMDSGNLMVLNNYAYHLATHGGDLNKAERMSERTIREEPDNPVYLDTYGWILHLQGQDELALFYLKRAVNHSKTEDNKVIRDHLKTVEK